MSNMIDPETVRQARQTDLAMYLLSKGEPLKKSGRRYKHEKHSSLVFTKNSYYWNSRNEHGNAVDYLERHMNMTFLDAIEELTGFTPPETSLGGGKMPETELDIKFNQDCKRAIAYLNKSRGISYNIIKYLLDENPRLLFQEERTNNIIFPMYDELNKLVGAELQGSLTDKRFKGIKSGSKYEYGFNVRFGAIDKLKYVLFFESSIDLLSFMDIKLNQENKSLNDCLLVSMGGLKIDVLKHILKTFTSDLRVVLCVDNDKAGEEFKTSVNALKIDFNERNPDLKYKDWNDQLRNIPQETLEASEEDDYLPL